MAQPHLVAATTATIAAATTPTATTAIAAIADGYAAAAATAAADGNGATAAPADIDVTAAASAATAWERPVIAENSAATARERPIVAEYSAAAARAAANRDIVVALLRERTGKPGRADGGDCQGCYGGFGELAAARIRDLSNHALLLHVEPIPSLRASRGPSA